MNLLITGVSGFIGSWTTEAALAAGWNVFGVDNFSDYYDRSLKLRNLQPSLELVNFTFHERDLARESVTDLLADVDAVIHLAGQPGVRGSWEAFSRHVDDNIIATQRLLNALKSTPSKRLVFASSSSVYGNADGYPVTESEQTRPVSPYGVSKLAAERLCVAYASEFGVDAVALRYFTVYGPRQRPDMAIQRLISAALSGSSFSLLGDGQQIRDFTYVDDVVRANLLAVEADIESGSVMNISGGSSVSMNDLIAAVEVATGRTIEVERQPPLPGDARRTGGSVERAAAELGWKPAVALHEGILRQVAWNLDLASPREG